MNRAALDSCAERRIGFTPDSMFLTFTLSIFSVAGLCSLLTGAAVDSIGERLCRSDWVGEHFMVISVAGRCLGWQGRLEPQRAIGRVGSDSPLIQFSMANYRQVFHPCFYRFSLLWVFTSFTSLAAYAVRLGIRPLRKRAALKRILWAFR